MEIVNQYLGWIALMAVALFIILYKRISDDPQAITSKYVHTCTIPREENFQNKIIGSLRRSGFVAIDYDPEEEKFYGKTKLNMSSWGENIIIKTQKLNDCVKLEFTSICAFPFQVFDWGKNKKNCRRFFKELNRLS